MITGAGIIVLGGPGRVGQDLVVQLGGVLPGIQLATPDVRPAGRPTALVIPLVRPTEAGVAAVAQSRRAFPGLPAVIYGSGLTVLGAVQLMRQPRTDVVVAEEEGLRAVVAALGRALGETAPSATAAPAPPLGTGSPAAGTFSSVRPQPAAAPAPANASAAHPKVPALPRGADALPVLDGRVGAVQELMAREECSLLDVEAVVAREVALVTAVVRTANSAWYHSPKVITNLHDAVVRIGVRQTLAILLETLVQQ